MKKFLLFAAIIIPFLTFASSGVMYKIQGNISDQGTKEPLAMVELLMMDKGDTVSSTMTNFDGNYTLYFFNPGIYTIHIEYLGFQSQNYQSMLFSKEFLDEPEARINFQLESILLKPFELYDIPDVTDPANTKPIISELQGVLTDKETGEPIPFANVIIYQKGVEITGGQSDFDGNYVISPIPPGKYSVKVITMGYASKELTDVTLRDQTTHFADLKLSPIGQNLESQIVEICCVKKLVSLPPSGGIKGKLIDKETDEPIPFAPFVIEKNGVQVSDGVSDFDGNFVLKELPPGKYAIKTNPVGYQPLCLTNISLKNEEIKFINIKLNPGRNCVIYCHGSKIRTEVEPAPITDLFSEQDSLNAEDDKLLPSSDFTTSARMVSFTVFPNPTMGELKISNLKGIDVISLVSLDGTLIKTLEIGLINSKTLDISLLKPGIYFLQYILEEKSHSHQIIKI